MLGFSGFCVMYAALFVIASEALGDSPHNPWHYPYAATLALMVCLGALLMAQSFHREIP